MSKYLVHLQNEYDCICETGVLQKGVYCRSGEVERWSTVKLDLQYCRSGILQKRRGETVERRGGEEERDREGK
jgi:hypothetical protein